MVRSSVAWIGSPVSDKVPVEKIYNPPCVEHVKTAPGVQFHLIRIGEPPGTILCTSCAAMFQHGAI